MKNVVVIGAGGHGKVVIDIIEKENKYILIGLLDSTPAAGGRLLGYEVLGTDADLPALRRRLDLYGVVVAIGDNWSRSQVVARVREAAPELVFVNCVHPSAQVARLVTM